MSPKVSEKAVSPSSSNSKLRIVNRRNSAAESTTEDFLSWPHEDIRKLLSRMKEHIPIRDHHSHKSRAKLLPWENIAFGNYTSEECYHMWKLVLQRIRGFRLLGEMLIDAESWLDRPWTNFYGSKKMNRHPDKPKAPCTANSLYIKDHYAKLKEENPKLSPTEIFALAQGNYKGLSDKKKKKYQMRAYILKQDYEREMALFLKEHPSEGANLNKIPKPKKSTAFNLYMESQMAKHADSQSDQPPKKLYSDIRAKWNNLKESKKLLWINKAEQLAAVSDSGDKPVSLLTKSEKKIMDKAKGKPSKPAPNVYALYTKIVLNSGELNEYNSKDRMRQVSLKWKNITEREKQKLAAQLASEMAEYKSKLEEFYKKNPEERMEQTNKKNTSTKKKPLKRPTLLSESSSDEAFQKKKLKKEINKIKLPKSESIVENNVAEVNELNEVKEPKCPASTPVLFFSKIMKKQKIKFGSETELTEAWNNLPKKERKAYKKSHAEAIEKYQTDYEAFLQSMTPKARKKYLKSKEQNE